MRAPDTFGKPSLKQQLEDTMAEVEAFLNDAQVTPFHTSRKADPELDDTIRTKAESFYRRLSSLVYKHLSKNIHIGKLAKITALCEKLGLIYKNEEFSTYRGVALDAGPEDLRHLPQVQGIRITTALGVRSFLMRNRWDKAGHLLYGTEPVRVSDTLHLGFESGDPSLGWTAGITYNELRDRVTPAQKGLTDEEWQSKIRNNMFGSFWRYGEITEATVAEDKKRRKKLSNRPEGSITLITDLARAGETLQGALPAFSEHFSGLGVHFKHNKDERKEAVLEQLAADVGRLTAIILEERDKPHPDIVRGRDGYKPPMEE